LQEGNGDGSAVLRRDQHDALEKPSFGHPTAKEKGEGQKQHGKEKAEGELKQIGLSWGTVVAKARDKTW
jgi:hypothetical protein